MVLNKCRPKKNLSTIIETPKELGPKSLVNIRLSRAEILLIWTNIPKRNVAWTNITVTAEICFGCSRVPTFKVWSKLGQ